MKRLIIAGAVVALVLALLAARGSSIQAQPVASITLPDPGGTVQLYPGCNNIALSFPDGTASETVVQAVTPAGAVESMWRHDAASGKFEGFTPDFAAVSDLMTVDFFDAVWLCISVVPPPGAVQGCPVEDADFCAFAAQVDAALRSGDTGFFVRHSRDPVTEQFDCDEPGLSVPQECVGAAPGTVVEKTGVWLGCLESEGWFATLEDLQDSLERDFSDAQPSAQDEYGEGGWRLYAVSFPSGARPPFWGPDDPDLLATAIGPDGNRRALVLSASQDSGTWKLEFLFDCSPGGLFELVLREAPGFASSLWGQ